MNRLLPLTLLLACNLEPVPLPGQFGEEDALECVEISVTPVADDAVIELTDDEADYTMSMAEQLAALDGTWTADLVWNDGPETEIGLTLQPVAGSVEQVVYEARDNGEEFEDAPPWVCSPRLRVGLEASVTTADGRLDETFSTVGVMDRWSTYLDGHVSGLSGTLDPAALSVDSVEPDQVHLSMQLLQGASNVPFAGSVYPVLASDPGEDVAGLGNWPIEGETEVP